MYKGYEVYFIIETEDQLKKLQVSEQCFVKVITNNDNYHPCISYPSVVYYNDGSKGYILCSKHSESFSIDFKSIRAFIQSHKKVYVLDKKFHSYFFDHSVLVDVNFTILEKTNKLFNLDCDALTKKSTYSAFSLEDNVNELVPISKHYESAECLYEAVREFIGLEENTAFYDDFCEAYRYVESQGIKFDSKYSRYFGIGTPHFFEKDNVTYSSYNLYNLTGRSTNAFNGFNFLSIPKTEEARSLMLPKNDFFVEFDFDGYHPRLISKLVDFEMSKESVHTQLGKQYFQKDSLTEEEYQESKRLTFKQLYGSIEDRFSNIEFFKSLSAYADKQYDRYKSDRSYVLPTGRVLVENSEITKMKLFNYVVQNYETLNNVRIINELRRYLSNKVSQLVLVTYDAFLVDFSVKDGQSTLAGVKSILETESMVVKHKHGKTYNFK